MSSRVILPLRVLIIVIALLALAGQVLVVPGLAALAAEEAPRGGAGLQVFLVIAGVAVLGCLQVLLGGIWALLGRVAAGRIFDGGSIRAVDVVIWALGVATGLVAAVLVVAGAWASAGPPAVGILLIGGLLVGATLVLLVVVMRGLLLNATALQHDLAEVV